MLVGLFGLQTIASRVATVISAAIASRSWRSCSSSGTRIARAPEARLELGIDRERRPGVDQLGARLEQRLTGGQEDVARAVADGDPLGGDVVAVRERARAASRWSDPGSG